MGTTIKANEKTKNSRPSIPQNIILALWSRAGGRCQFNGCNKELWHNKLTFSKLNTSNIAHIVSYSPNGPRGDQIRSKKLEKDLDNLMLVCRDCHAEIDNKDLENEYPEEFLLQMKEEHENRIKSVGEIISENKSTILTYGARVGQHTVNINDNESRLALRPKYYPCEKINLGLINSSWQDKENDFWNIEKTNLEKLFNKEVNPRLENNEIKHLSIFAIAPQPLLMYLGCLISSITYARTYQLHNNPQSWAWKKTQIKSNKYIINRPNNKTGIPVLTISLSAKITGDRIAKVITDPFSHWDITIEKPSRNFLRTEKQLYEFNEVVGPLIDEIKAEHGQDVPLHVFPAMPVSTAVEFGRLIMPKATMPIKVYDQNNDLGGFVYAMDLY